MNVSNFIYTDLLWIEEIFNEEELNSTLSNFLASGIIKVIRPWGFIRYKIKEDSSSFICELAIHLSKRGKGISSLLLSTIPCPTWVAVYPENMVANIMYQKAGFRHIGECFDKRIMNVYFKDA